MKLVILSKLILNMTLFVYPVLPQTGLSNMLFIWARAKAASVKYDAEMIPPQWFKPFRIGPILRREKSLRYYTKDFSPSNFNLTQKIKLLTFAQRLPEEELKNIKEQNIQGDCVFVFQGFKKYFIPILNNQKLIYESLIEISSDFVRASFEEIKHEQYIGVHVRRGDFKITKQAIPTDWYIKTCQFTRNLLGNEIPIKVFSDAPASELQDLMSLPNLTLVEGNPALLDLLMLSNSKIIIGTSMSTFSLWAAYLGGSVTVWPPVSPGAYGYGLHTNQHVMSDWEGKYNIEQRLTF